MKKINLSEVKNWNTEVETEITSNWKEAEFFKFDRNTKKKIYSIDTPPPYINAPIHIGHAVTYCFMDMFARYKRMKNFEVIFPLGLDRNGLPIEMGAEKKYKISAFHMSREEFVGYCRRLLEETSGESIDSFAKLGISFTSYKESDDIGAVYKTDDAKYRALTQSTFIELFKKGIVYEDARINNWDPKLRTTIADSEIEYKDLPSTFNDVKWKVKETGEEIIIATTRPELICSCGQVIYHPDDKRYKHLKGKTAVSPLFHKEIKIQPNTLAEPEKGSGIVMMCSAGDLSDIQFFREQGLTPIISINIDGTMNSNAGAYEGLKVKEAREKIIEDLKAKGLLVKQEKITHRTPVSERSGAEIEFIEMPEFYLKQMDIKEKIRELAKKEINFYPESSKKILFDWIDSIAIDWPISRRRFYATEIPLWSAELNGEKIYALPKKMKYYQPWKEEVPNDAEVWTATEKVGEISDKKFKNLKWIGETRVFDTWMDSSISELYLLKYKTDDEFFKRAYPASLRPQGKEIVRTWLYYTLLRGYLETGKACFDDVWVHQHILDGQGFKMSKSKGNAIDPHMLLEKYGAEAIRFWSAIEGDLSKSDFKCSEERISGERKTLNKILNVNNFTKLFEKPSRKPKLTKLDKLLVDYIEGLTKYCEENYDKYDFNHPAQELRKFVWDIFASNYVELVKNRAYNQEGVFSDGESNSAKWTLHFVWERFLHLLYPILPQITSVIAEDREIDLLHSDWPKSEKVDFENVVKKIDEIMVFNNMIWKAKKEKGISLREEIKGIEIPDGLKDFESDLKVAHKI